METRFWNTFAADQEMSFYCPTYLLKCPKNCPRTLFMEDPLKKTHCDNVDQKVSHYIRDYEWEFILQTHMAWTYTKAFSYD